MFDHVAAILSIPFVQGGRTFTRARLPRAASVPISGPLHRDDVDPVEQHGQLSGVDRDGGRLGRDAGRRNRARSNRL